MIMMAHRKIDSRIKVLIENGILEGHRTMFVVIGEKARDQVVLLNHMLLKCAVNKLKSSTLLWCSKKEMGLNSRYCKKRIKSLKNKVKAGKLDVDTDDPFELFLVTNDIQYCFYNETYKILGNTYRVCILDDFQALTPNLLARTTETVEGGGLIVILLQSMNSLKQLYTMSMDVHERFRTEAHQHVICRFNERFIMSLASCEQCLVVDDSLNVLPITLENLNGVIAKEDTSADEKINLNIFKKNLKDIQLVSDLIDDCKTFDQAKALSKFIEIIAGKTLNSIVSLTAARGRGKSATLGLAVAAAVALNYSNIYITSPSAENLKTLFKFIIKGFDALAYKEYVDYGIMLSTNPDFNKAIVQIDIFRNHRQTIQYIHPNDAQKLSHVELLVIDEAAAIPLPYIKAMLGSYHVFLSSTINGYEGTGRSLSLKLIQQLRTQAASSNIPNDHDGKPNIANGTKEGKCIQMPSPFHELTLDESIRYKPGDKVEQWLTNILCLDTLTYTPSLSWCPSLDTCQLYYINRDTLFSYHKASELFLQRLVALYVSSHYKNSPNDLQMMCDAPAHHLFCLLGPIDPVHKSLPEILVVIQVCLEGEIKKETVAHGLGRGRRAAGDLIPWTIAQQYQDEAFAQLAGARIVRIATHPNYHGKGYGSRALQLLKQYYGMKISYINGDSGLKLNNIIPSADEDSNLFLDKTTKQRVSVPPLLSKLSERPPERLDYLGVSFGLTESLLKFWKRLSFVPVYLRQTINDVTGEHSCIMLSKINEDENENSNWLETYWKDFRRRFIMLLSYTFNTYSPSLALSILTNETFQISKTIINENILDIYFTSCDLKRLEMYSKNIADYHMIMDLMPSLSKLYFLNLMGDIRFSHVQTAILIGLGFQHKTAEKVANELNLPISTLLSLFNRIVRKSIQYFNGITGDTTDNAVVTINNVNNEVHGVFKNESNIESTQLKQNSKILNGKCSNQNRANRKLETKPNGIVKSGIKRLISPIDVTVLQSPRERKQRKKNNFQIN